MHRFTADTKAQALGFVLFLNIWRSLLLKDLCSNPIVLGSYGGALDTKWLVGPSNIGSHF